ncbi:MAG: M6 family metalloprotease domain-containing protein [Proteobacteria bacterium]|nr:M6 family metalloprotease domain-containing protein [Pseudomonadota bacterium]
MNVNNFLNSILQDATTKHWVYAVQNWDGSLVSSGVRVPNDKERSAVELGIKKSIRPLAFPQPKSLSSSGNSSALLASAVLNKQLKAETSMFVVPPTGTANVPVILINFNNTTTTNTAGQFNTLLFGTGNASMKDYYQEVSYGKFTVSPGPSGVVGWYEAAQSHNYYDDNNGWTGDLIYEAAAAAESAGYNFAAYDKDGDCYVDVIAVVHQGKGEEASIPSDTSDIWSHRWSLNSAKASGQSHYGEYVTQINCPAGGKIKVNDYIIQPERLYGGMQTIGVFAHEYGHSLGLPDLYDTDGSSQGIGHWSLMASGNWNGVTQSGDRPAHFDAWSKYKLGWIGPIKVTGTLINQPVKSANSAADVYQLLGGSPALGGEYFLVENRQKAGFDIGLPGSGLLVWHIDESRATSDNTDNAFECYPGGPTCASQHYHVALVQADNAWHLEEKINRGDAGDSYPGTSNNTSFNATSSPNSNLYNGAASNVNITNISASASTMTATMGILTPAQPDFVVSALSITPTTPEANASFTASVTVKNQGTTSGTVGTVQVWANQPTTQACSAVGDKSTTVGSLAAGASTTVTISGLTADSVGAKTLRAYSDSNCQTSEMDETNNQTTLAYNVVAPVVYKLTVTPSQGGRIASNPNGIDCGTICSADFTHGTQVGLTATPISNFAFLGWGGACSGTGACNVTMDAAKNVTGDFKPIAYSLTVAVTGKGTVTSNPIGINCDTSCSSPFNQGTSVNLTASPQNGFVFAGWTGACGGTTTCAVTMDSAKNVNATFSPTSYPLLVTVVGYGSVTSTPTGINCGVTCGSLFNLGQTVTLTATPNQGYVFANWTGGECSGNAITCTVTMNAAKSITATFNPGPWLPTVIDMILSE